MIYDLKFLIPVDSKNNAHFSHLELLQLSSNINPQTHLNLFVQNVYSHLAEHLQCFEWMFYSHFNWQLLRELIQFLKQIFVQKWNQSYYISNLHFSLHT